MTQLPWKSKETFVYAKIKILKEQIGKPYFNEPKVWQKEND